jgi:hypothetical protein
MKNLAVIAAAVCFGVVVAYFGSTAFGAHTKTQRIIRQQHRQRTATPTALEFGDALTQTGSITHIHCVQAAPGAYMCAYTVLRAGHSECHLMQGRWTPHAASTITVTLAGRSRRCGTVRQAIQSLT